MRPSALALLAALLAGGPASGEALLHLKGYGLANLEHTVPTTPQTLFNAGSLAKQFTARPTEAELAELAGPYYSDEVAAVYTLLVREEALCTLSDELDLLGVEPRRKETRGTAPCWRPTG